ncbi:hypothetical protein RKE29_01235 [Streptomyces sp. B1866]|uniref:hypothetical protein n=1 Tax=Streptomyces sp. B1866 TaxID=3075431 RepID=UPI002890A180|nr:hypothetical protein [Streptomyces sp. B1866]MDT3395284.1 hypothetical protein [Streptomyces sp. B1866]
MRTIPATAAEADAWLTVLHTRGHLHRLHTGPDGAWTVHRTPDSPPWTLHDPVLAMDYVAAILRDVRRRSTPASR